MNKKMYKIEPDKSLDQKMSDFQQLCHETGLKVTPQRLAIYKELASSTEHPSANMVWEKVRRIYPSISLDTVNRTLITLSKIGAAFVVEGSGDVKRFDGGMAVHQHFRCIQCKRIIDFHYKPFDIIALPRQIENSFLVMRKTVYLEGICQYCRKKN